MVAVAGALILMCQRAPMPPAAPVLSPEGRSFARQLLFALRTVQTAADLGELMRPFDFSPAFIDSPRLAVGFWDPRQFAQDVGKGLGKKAAALRQPFAPLTSGLAKSTGTAVRQMRLGYAIDSATLDSVRQIDSSSIRLTHAADTVAGVWTTAGDSIYGRWMHDSSGAWVAVFDSLRRSREKDSSVVVTDLELWRFVDNSNLALLRKTQDQRRDTVVAFRHSVVIVQGVLLDSIAVALGRGHSSVFAKRQDNSAQWWTRADSSQLFGYSDVAVDSVGMTTTTLLQSGLYDFTNTTSAQTVGIHVTSVPAGGITDSTATDCVEAIGPAPGSFAVVSCSTTDYSLVATTAYTLAVHDSLPCSLYVKLDMFSAGPSGWLFGKPDSSRFTYVIQHDSTWGMITYTSSERIDYFGLLNHLASVTWAYTPRQAVPLTGGDRTGLVSVTALYRTGSQTFSRCWTDRRGAGDTAMYLWAGAAHDTMKTTYVSDTASHLIRYTCEGPQSVRRSGVILTGAAQTIIADTLYDLHSDSLLRVTAATAHGSIVDSVSVTGIDTFGLSVSGDSIVVAPGSGAPTVKFAWTKGADSSYAARIENAAGSVTYAYSLTRNPEGCTGGSVTGGPAGPSARSLTLLPTYNGSAALFGVIDNISQGTVDNPDAVPMALTIDLWAGSTLGDDTKIR